MRHASPFSSVLTSVLGSSCAGCNQPGATLCQQCRFVLTSSPARTVHGVRAPLAFEGVARQVVHALKYRNRRQVAGFLARLMVQRLHLGLASPVDLVTWSPTSAGRARSRGYDQAELLARAVARELGVPCRRLLYRSHSAAPQTGRGRAERLEGPEFRARPAGAVPVAAGTRSPLHVLVIDDVVTTGATLHAARQALLEAGVSSVQCVAAAGTQGALPVGSGLPWESSTESSVPVKARN